MDAGGATLHDGACKRFHGVLRDRNALASGKRGFGGVKARQQLSAAALALDPKRHRFLHGLSRAVYAPRLYGAPHEVALLRRKVDFHVSSLGQ